MLKLKLVPVLLVLFGRLALCEDEPEAYIFQDLPAPHISAHHRQDGCGICDRFETRLELWKRSHQDELQAAQLMLALKNRATFKIGCAIEQPFFFDRVKTINEHHAHDFMIFIEKALELPEGTLTMDNFRTVASPRNNYCHIEIKPLY